MPWIDTLEYPRTRAYIGKALYRSGYQKNEKASLTEQILNALRHVEAKGSDSNLLGRIEDKLTQLSSTKKRGVSDHELDLLQMAIRCLAEPHFRRKREKIDMLGDAVYRVYSGEESPLESVANEELRQHVQKQLDGLTPEQKLLIRSKYWDGMSEAEFGRKTGQDRRRVNEAGKAAMQILRERLKTTWADYV